MRIHAADWWLFVQRYSASARHCLKDSGLPRIFGKAAIHRAKAVLLGQNSTSVETSICETTFMKMLVAIICQQSMNRLIHKSIFRGSLVENFRVTEFQHHHISPHHIHHTSHLTTSLTSHITRHHSHLTSRITHIVAGAPFCDVAVSLFLARKAFGDVQFSWQAQHLVMLQCHFSWQVQHLVMLQCHFSWQAHHLVKFG